MYHKLPSIILGFHGCDKEVGLKLINGEIELNSSNNKWDWLGNGIYFWEQNPLLALEYATDISKGTQKAGGKIKTPFVVGAILDLGHCLNLAEYNSLQIIKEGFHALKQTTENAGATMLVNKANNRALDCAVIQYIHNSNKELGNQEYDSVRGAYMEGNPLYEGTTFSEKNHIQICIRNKASILGFFLPQPITKFNPSLK